MKIETDESPLGEILGILCRSALRKRIVIVLVFSREIIFLMYFLALSLFLFDLIGQKSAEEQTSSVVNLLSFYILTFRTSLIILLLIILIMRGIEPLVDKNCSKTINSRFTIWGVTKRHFNLRNLNKNLISSGISLNLHQITTIRELFIYPKTSMSVKEYSAAFKCGTEEAFSDLNDLAKKDIIIEPLTPHGQNFIRYSRFFDENGVRERRWIVAIIWVILSTLYYAIPVFLLGN